MGKVMRETFLPCLLFRKSKTRPPVVGSLSTFQLNKFGMGLRNPMMSEKDTDNSFLCAICELIGAVTGKQEFPTDDHIQAVKGDR